MKFKELAAHIGGEKRIAYDLTRLKKALTDLGHPEKSAHTLIIGGTNGKGSTSLFLSAALVEAGHAVQTYLSPHLQHPRERILENLVAISSERLDALAEALTATALRRELSYFELVTLMNFVHAQETRPDFLVLEVGLGGRLDATNVTDPLVAVVTSIGLDHTQYLGGTEELILAEKLGIVPKEGLLFSGVTQPGLRKAIEQHCDALDTIYYHGSEVAITDVKRNWDGQTFKIHQNEFALTNPMPVMAENAKLAYLALQIAFPSIPISSIQSAFRRVWTPCRFERMQTNPTVILSGDHNVPGIVSLLDTLDRLPSRRLHALCGFSTDKPAVAMMEALSRRIASLRLTDLPGQSVPYEFEPRVPYTRDCFEALNTALEETPKDEILLVTGSLYLTGALRTKWQSEVEFVVNRREVPAPISLSAGEPIQATLHQAESAQNRAR